MRITTWTGAMLAVILCAVLSTAGETGSISGRVVGATTGQAVAGATVLVEGTGLRAQTAADGTYLIPNVPAGEYTIRVEAPGLAPVRLHVTVTVGKAATVDVRLTALAKPDKDEAGAARKNHLQATPEAKAYGGHGVIREAPMVLDRAPRRIACPPRTVPCERPPYSWRSPGFESYDTIDENAWHSTLDDPLSTFSVDVDAASYGNVRRFLTQGQLPPADAVRIEELVNYFDYDYPDPRGRDPFSITTEVAGCPWNPEHALVHIGLQGERIPVKNLPPSNLVFLIDVSGSMSPPNKLPLLQASFRMLVDNLRPQDRVAIVVYAGAAGLVLPSTCGSDRERILCAIDRLHAGGSTAGGAGLRLAYRIARDNFIDDGNNRIILATDGDFNVGLSSDGDMVRLIEQERRSGVFLTVLGFGEGNLKDSKMEKIADKGNGHYAYIDNIMEAQKVLINEMGATLLTIAKDVKLQVEFNPARVASYRLIGYEDRVLQNRDFDDDTKDAGEIGAGHSVTALYEIALADRDDGERPGLRPLRYSDVTVRNSARRSSELLTVSFRYKPPSASESRLLRKVVKDRRTRFAHASDDFRFSAAVAEFGMILRNSPERGEATMADVIAAARGARGEDAHGYRAEFVRLAQTAEMLLTPTLGRR